MGIWRVFLTWVFAMIANFVPKPETVGIVVKTRFCVSRVKTLLQAAFLQCPKFVHSLLFENYRGLQNFFEKEISEVF